MQGCPAADVIHSLTAPTWIDDLWNDPRFSWSQPEQDAERIAEAFRKVRRHCDRWPQLTDFTRHLPEPQRDNRLALPARAFTNEERAANMRRLAEMLADLGGSP